MLDQIIENITYRRSLPHIYQHNHPVFITWRLKHDLPSFMKKHLVEMKQEHERKCTNLSEDLRRLNSYNYHKQIFDWFDCQLGIINEYPDILKREDFAQIIINAFQFHDNTKYKLHAYCIMPNHIHVLITPYASPVDYKQTLSKITQSWKRFTARKINLLLGKEGSFWAKESYDHYVRNENELFRIINYILQNPVKARLVNNWKEWKNSWVDVGLEENIKIV